MSKSIREISGLVLLHVYDATEEDLQPHVAGWRKKTAKNMDVFPYYVLKYTFMHSSSYVF